MLKHMQWSTTKQSHRFVNSENKTKKNKRNQGHFLKKQTKLTGKLEKEKEMCYFFG